MDYASFDSIRATLDYDFSQGKNFSYEGLTIDEAVRHIAKFTSGIWQIHLFGDDHVIIRTKLEKPSKINGLALI